MRSVIRGFGQVELFLFLNSKWVNIESIVTVTSNFYTFLLPFDLKSDYVLIVVMELGVIYMSTVVEKVVPKIKKNHILMIDRIRSEVGNVTVYKVTEDMSDLDIYVFTSNRSSI